jgi:ankyrin repeat protein
MDVNRVIIREFTGDRDDSAAFDSICAAIDDGPVALGVVTEELLRLRNGYGETPLHVAAKRGKLKNIPSELLSREAMTVFDCFLMTPLHYATLFFHLDDVPRGILTRADLVYHTLGSRSVFNMALSSGQLKAIPMDLFSPDKGPLTRELFQEEGAFTQNTNQTYLHVAARTGGLKDLPREFLTAETMAFEDMEEQTPLHVAALKSHLDQVPVALLTHKALAARRCDGNTVYHLAAHAGCLDQLPGGLRTQEMYGLKNGRNETVTNILEAAKERIRRGAVQPRADPTDQRGWLISKPSFIAPATL